MANKKTDGYGHKSVIEKLADFLTNFFGTVTFLTSNLLFFTLWIIFNLDIVPGFPVFDPYPFGMLTMIVSLEAIVLTIIILISQNRTSRQDKSRAEADYQVNVKAEKMIIEISKKLDKVLKDVAD